jgi:hypothetical protein
MGSRRFAKLCDSFGMAWVGYERGLLQRGLGHDQARVEALIAAIVFVRSDASALMTSASFFINGWIAMSSPNDHTKPMLC